MTKMQLEQCIEAYGTELFSFCCRLTGSRQEAEELYQDTFLKAIELRAGIDWKQNPKSYLVSIALRIWKNRKRKYAWRSRIAKIQPLLEDSEMDAQAAELSFANPTEEQWLSRERSLLVRKAVAGLSEKLQMPVYLFYTMQFSISEIAELLKIPPGTVKNRLHKARVILKEKLEVVLDET